MIFNHHILLIFPELITVILKLNEWCEKINATLGVTGSALCVNFKSLNDVDLFVILDPSHKEEIDSIDSPPFFSKDAWKTYITLLKENEVDIFGTYCIANSSIHLELYTFNLVKRIFNLETFIIRRLKCSPTKPKIIRFHGTNGKCKDVLINPLIQYGLFFSEIENVIWDKEILYVGMHLERLLLSSFINKSPLVDQLRNNSWNSIKSLFLLHSNAYLPYDRHFENIFHLSAKLPYDIRLQIRSKLHG